MFDFAALDVLTGAEQGRPMEVLNPKTGLPYTQPVPGAGPDEKGVVPTEAVTITLRGRASAVAREVAKAIDDEKAALIGQGRTVTDEMEEAWNARYLAALTVTWNFTQMDGHPFPPTPGNAEKLWRDPRWPFLRRRALAFVAADGNFLSGSA